MAVKGRYVTDKEYIVVQVFVGQPAEFPVVRERAVTLQPGREHFLEMGGYTVTTDQEAESLDVQYRSHLALHGIPFMYHYVKCRQCYTRGEGQLEYHGVYTYSSCQLECRIRRAEQLAGCVPWYLPQSPAR